MATVTKYPHRNHDPDDHRMINLGGPQVCACICPLCSDVVTGECICADCTGHWPTDGAPLAKEAA